MAPAEHALTSFWKRVLFPLVFLNKGLRVTESGVKRRQEEKEVMVAIWLEGNLLETKPCPMAQRKSWVGDKWRGGGVRRGSLWRGLIERWRWAAALQKARGKGWHASWVSENCSENSSGLLLVLGAPTTSESKGTLCQQSAFHHPQSPAAFRSRRAPPLHSWHYLDFPRSESRPMGKYS